MRLAWRAPVPAHSLRASLAISHFSSRSTHEPTPVPPCESRASTCFEVSWSIS